MGKSSGHGWRHVYRRLRTSTLMKALTVCAVRAKLLTKPHYPRKISGSSFVEGKNYAWINPSNPSVPGAKALRYKVHKHDRLVNFIIKTLGKPLSHFIETSAH